MAISPRQQQLQPTGPHSLQDCLQRDAIAEIRTDVRETRTDVKTLLERVGDARGSHRLIERIVMIAIGGVITVSIGIALRGPSPVRDAAAASGVAQPSSAVRCEPSAVTVILPPTPTTTATLPTQARREP